MEHCWRIFQLKQHFSMFEKTMLCGKSFIIDLFFNHFDLPLARVGVETWNHLQFAQRSNISTHPSAEIAIFFCGSIEITIVDLKALASVLLGHEWYWKEPFCYKRFSRACRASFLFICARVFVTWDLRGTVMISVWMTHTWDSPLYCALRH